MTKMDIIYEKVEADSFLKKPRKKSAKRKKIRDNGKEIKILDIYIPCLEKKMECMVKITQKK